MTPYLLTEDNVDSAGHGIGSEIHCLECGSVNCSRLVMTPTFGVLALECDECGAEFGRGKTWWA